MAAGRLLLPSWMPALDGDGNPIPNAKVFFYLNQTDDLAPVYSDEALTIPLANPVLANAQGRFPAVWADDSVLYSASVEAPYGPAGVPFTYDNLSASMAADILVAGAAEAAADEAEAAAGVAEAAAAEAAASLEAIEEIASGAPDAPSVVNKANKNGSNVEAADFRAALGLGDAAQKNTGTTEGTVAAGDDSRIVGAAQRDAESNEFTGDQIVRGQVSIGAETTTEETAKFYVGHISTNPSPPIGPAVAAIQCRMDFQPTGDSGANPDGVYGTLWYNSAATFNGAGAAVRANAYTIAQPADAAVNVLNLVGLYGRARHEAKGTVTRAMSVLADGGPFTKAAGAGTIDSIMGMYVVASATANKNYGVLFSGSPADGSIAAEANTDLSYRVTGTGSQEFTGFGRSARAVVTVMANASAQNYGQIAFGSTAGVYGTASAAASGVVVYGCSLYMNTNTGDYRRQNTILRPSGLIFNRTGDGTAEIAFATTGTQDSIIGGFTSAMSWDSSGVTTVGGHVLPATDNVANLGSGTNRFKEVFAAASAINTSDATEKTDLQPVPDAVKRAVANIPWGQFQWLDAIAEKGEDGARIHFGTTAQAVQAAFEAEGLDPRRYGLFCVDPVMEEYIVESERHVERPVTERVSVMRSVVEVIDGVAVQTQIEDFENRQVVDEYPVVDANGDQVFDVFEEYRITGTREENGPEGQSIRVPVYEKVSERRVRVHRVPRMETVAETVTHTERRQKIGPDGQPMVRLGLRYDHLFALIAMI